jgi:hypothetical protein
MLSSTPGRLDLLGSLDQIGRRESQAGSQPAQTRVARVAVAVLHVGDPALVEIGPQRKLLLQAIDKRLAANMRTAADIARTLLQEI